MTVTDQTPDRVDTPQDAVDGPQSDETSEVAPTSTEGESGPENGVHEPEEGGETFPRSYVERLRAESARYRQRASRTDEYAAALWEARVAASGRMADATDLPMPEGADPLDVEAVDAAIDELLARKPHLASRTPRGDVGQGAVASGGDGVNLASILRANAG